MRLNSGRSLAGCSLPLELLPRHLLLHALPVPASTAPLRFDFDQASSIAVDSHHAGDTITVERRIANVGTASSYALKGADGRSALRFGLP